MGGCFALVCLMLAGACCGSCTRHTLAAVSPMLSTPAPLTRRRPSPAFLQRLQAFLRVVRADHLCPQQLPSRPTTHRHLMAYLDSLWDGEEVAGAADVAPPAAGGGKKGKGKRAGGQQPAAVRAEVADARGSPLGRALQLYVCSTVLPSVDGVWAARDAADILCDPVAAPRAEAALEELAGLAAMGAAPGAPPPLPTLAQMRHACHCGAVVAALMQLAPRPPGMAGPPPLRPADRDAVLAVARASGDALLALEPDSPKSWGLAAAMASIDPALARDEELRRCLRAASLGQQQGRPYWVARAGAEARNVAGAGGPLGDAQAAALERLPQPEGALDRCRHLLPQVRGVGHVRLLRRHGRLCPASRGRCASPLTPLHTRLCRRGCGRWKRPLPPACRSSSGGRLPRSRRPPSAGQALRETPTNPQQGAGCHVCGKASATLLRCGRCKKAAPLYCGSACQRQDWPKHRVRCNPA